MKESRYPLLQETGWAPGPVWTTSKTTFDFICLEYYKYCGQSDIFVSLYIWLFCITVYMVVFVSLYIWLFLYHCIYGCFASLYIWLLLYHCIYGCFVTLYIWLLLYHCIYGCFVSLCIWLYVCTLLFNFVNYVFLLLCIILLVSYSYCYLRSVLGILFHCVVLCIVCG